MGKLTPERRKELEELRKQVWGEDRYVQDNSDQSKKVNKNFLEWIYRHFPLDCKFTSAWID